MKKLYYLVPFASFAAFIFGWQSYVTAYAVPSYLLPSPALITATLIADWPILAPALLTTLGLTLAALCLAVTSGVLLAVLLTSAKLIEYAFLPFAIFLQVTPIIAVAPLILVYAPGPSSATLFIAWMVAFFPVLTTTMFGLKSTSRDLKDLFALYDASSWQRLYILRFPAALPHFLSGLRLAAGLSLIGAIVAEFSAGSLGAGEGLAYRLIEASYRSNMLRMFACLVLISLSGLFLYAIVALVSFLLLRRWHESARI